MVFTPAICVPRGGKVGVVISVRILEKRQQRLQVIFGRISRSSIVPVFFRSTSSAALIGLGKDLFGRDLRSVRLATRVESIFVNYYEVWLSQSGGREFNLEKAYLHLDRPYPDGTGDQEVLALHCDPIIPESDPSFLYKRGPHLHISSKMHDISRAHIALCHGEVEDTCNNYEAFSNSLSSAIQMIDAELLEKVGY